MKLGLVLLSNFSLGSLNGIIGSRLLNLAISASNHHYTTPQKNGSMLVLFLLVFFTPASVRSEWLSNLEASNNPNEIQEKGVLFHERSKILLAEKFIKIEFLVPFPTYDFALKPDIVALMAKFASMWELPSVFCPLDFSSHFSTNSTPFNVTWMLQQIETEIHTAELDVALLRNETAMFLSPPQQQRNTRHRRGSQVGLAALAAVGLFGGGVALGSSDSSGLQGIFGSCQDDTKANAENIRKLSDFQDVLTQYVTEFTTSKDKKFFMVENELAPFTTSKGNLLIRRTKIGHLFNNSLMFLSIIFTYFGTATSHSFQSSS